MNLIEQKIHDYAEETSTQENDILKQLTRETHLKVMNPIMLCGFLQGRFLEMISSMMRAENILEIGTYTGYSAICLAQGLHEHGTLHTIEKDPELEEICRKYFKLSGLEHKIQLHIGDAMQVIPNFDMLFDLVYIDCDKELYTDVYKLVFEKVKPRGYIIADNVLWHGKIFDEKQRDDKETKAIVEFNNYIKNDKRAENYLLPFRDGIMIIQKK